MRAPAAWRERAPPPGHTIGQRPVFACCTEAWAAVRESALAARRCGACGGLAALRATDAALATLLAHCRAAHARLAPAPPARAARWLADDDIARFLQTLPNYRAAVDRTDYTAQELKQAYEREAEILGTSLGDGEVSSREIVADINTLVDLALFCESMDWLSTNIKTIPSLVGAPTAGGLKLTEKFLNDLAATAAVFDEIAQKCLIFLHLEVSFSDIDRRFYYDISLNCQYFITPK
ncbi:unnamed protein product [Euphydryas editha]|uniref:Exocyst complex component Sec8 n=1 Tax=Euphydryas editha TaxID=104508 RepID=A0AAU9V918_EUPED|nr:unnamed protein product [Euphydryas editha]